MAEKTEKPRLNTSTDWPEEAVTWFEHLRQSPLTDAWSALDWDFAERTAVLVGLFYQGDTTVLKEMKEREEAMGILTFKQPGSKPVDMTEKGKLLSLVIGDRERRSSSG